MRRGGSIDGARILSPLSVRLMSTNQVGTLHSSTGLGFGLGFETVDRFGANGMSGEGAFGWGGAYGSTYRVDPEARLVMVLMIQLIPNTTDLGDGVSDRSCIRRCAEHATTMHSRTFALALLCFSVCSGSVTLGAIRAERRAGSRHLSRSSSRSTPPTRRRATSPKPRKRWRRA